MSKKKKIVSTAEDFIPDVYSDESRPDLTDPAAWKFLTKKNTAPMSPKEKKREKERLKVVEHLYPVFERKQIPLEHLKPSDPSWNFFQEKKSDVLEELMKNIAVYGQLSPAIVWEQEDGYYMILGGNTRYYAIKKLHELYLQLGEEAEAAKFATLDCNVYGKDELDDVEAQKLLIFDNVIRRENTAAMRAKAVISLNKLEQDTREKRRWNVHRERTLQTVAKALGESEGAVKYLYSLRTLIPEFWPLLDAPKGEKSITLHFAKHIAGMPAKLQRYIFAKKLYRQKVTGQRLKLLLQAASPKEVEKIFADSENYTISAKGSLSEKLPENYVTFPLTCAPEELETVRKSILLLTNRPDISKKTRDILEELLQG